jgi:class 3 adenylate cyclase
LGHEIGLGIGIAHGFATLGTIGFEGRFDYAARTVSNVASRLCGESKPAQILISPRVLMKVGNAVKVELVEVSLFGRHRGECPFRRDGEDFVIVSLAEDLVVYRNDDASGLRNSVICFGGKLQ